MLYYYIIMVIYECNKCYLIFTKKSSYIVHINRKTSCIIEYIITEDNKFKCMYCDSIFTRVDNCKFHIQSCNSKILKLKENENIELKQKLEEKNKDLEEKNKELEKFKKMYNELVSKTTIPIQNNITNNTTNDNSIINNTDNSVTNNIVNQNIIIKFGEEDITKLTPKEVKSILSSGFQAVQESFKLINCNPRLKEQINSYIPNLRAPYAYIYDGEKFVVKDINQVLEDIINSRCGDIQELYNNNNTKMTNIQQKSIQGLLKKIKENDKKIINEDKKEIRIAMYNNKDNIEIPKKKKTKNTNNIEVI
jgi:hypothetical protein